MNVYFTKTYIIITTVCTAGVFGIIYYFFIRKKDNILGNDKDINKNDKKKTDKSANNQDNQLHITKNINFNLVQNIDTKIEKIDDLYFNGIINTEERKITEKSNDVRYTEPNKHTQRNSYYLLETETKLPTERPSCNKPKQKIYDDKFEGGVPENSTIFNPFERKKQSNKNSEDSMFNKFSNLNLKKTIENMNFENVQYKQFLQDLEGQGIKDIPFIQNISNNLIDTKIVFESDGYVEESEDMKKDDLILSDQLSLNHEKKQIKTDGDNQMSKYVMENDKIVIKNDIELEEILMGKLRFKEYNCILNLIDKEIQEKEILSIIKEKELLVVLEYLYTELHPGLIELSDNFINERRRYFKVDHETYISIVNYFLRKKEEFFLCVLSDLMSKLNISQKVLDNTFFYYMNIADGNIKEIKMIRQAYDKVYHAGLKYSIFPKTLTKMKLHKILEFQCETYEKLIKEYPEYENDVIEIMVTDHVYLEYGLDREAIKAALKKFSIHQDEEFSKVRQKLENFQNNSFINI